ncbi:MAG TPA: glycosyltransferase, partial [Pirellulales bacterium]|nr:glycosyltransferase [Pirellulales bacterium]
DADRTAVDRTEVDRDIDRCAVDPPGVTILKPLCGADDDLEANLESFAALEYPRLQIVLGAADRNDPALTVARAVFARHPEVDAKVVVLDHVHQLPAQAFNPKVKNLAGLYAHAAYDLCLISDSNVRVRPDEIQSLVAPFADPKVGLVYQPVVGVGEQTIAAAIENLKLTTLSGHLMVFVKQLTGWDVVMGKGMMFRREALDDIGGFQRVANVAAEDYVLGVALAEAGWNVALASVPVQAVHTRWSWRGVINRTYRHAAMRCRLCTWSYPIELGGNPVFLATLGALIFGLSWVPYLVITVVLKTMIDARACQLLRGQKLSIRDLLLLPVKDLLFGIVWLPAIFGRTVRWRGNTLRLGWGTVLRPVGSPPIEPVRPTTRHLPRRTKRKTTVSR